MQALKHFQRPLDYLIEDASQQLLFQQAVDSRDVNGMEDSFVGRRQNTQACEQDHLPSHDLTVSRQILSVTLSWSPETKKRCTSTTSTIAVGKVPVSYKLV